MAVVDDVGHLAVGGCHCCLLFDGSSRMGGLVSSLFVVARSFIRFFVVSEASPGDSARCEFVVLWFWLLVLPERSANDHYSCQFLRSCSSDNHHSMIELHVSSVILANAGISNASCKLNAGRRSDSG